MKTSAVSIRNVSFTYAPGQAPALQNISLEIPAGRTVLFVGRSGSGKSTILRLVNGLLPDGNEASSGPSGENNTAASGETDTQSECNSQSSAKARRDEVSGILTGSVRINGQNIRDLEMWQLSEMVGTVFQNPRSQFFNLDTTDEILFGLESRGASHDEMAQALQEVSAAMDLQPLLDRNIFDLSGGEKQRIAFASIYVMNPDIYILDEPSSNLDEESILRLRESIIHLRGLGKTVLIAEHRLWYVADLADEVILVENGRLARHMSGREFLSMRDEERRSCGLRSIHEIPMPVSHPAGKSSVCPPVSCGLSLRGLAAAYGRHRVWSHLNLDLKPGVIYAITGGNGAGKSTLARILCGLRRPAAGEIFWNGKALSLRQRRALCFLVMQDVNAQLFADSVMEEVMLDQEDTQDARQKAAESLRTCSLLEYRERHPMTLSGGQKQRLAIADAMTIGRKAVVFDEPTSGLDYDHMMAFVRILKDMQAQGTLIAVITHDTEFIAASGATVLDLTG